MNKKAKTITGKENQKDNQKEDMKSKKKLNDIVIEFDLAKKVRVIRYLHTKFNSQIFLGRSWGNFWTKEGSTREKSRESPDHLHYQSQHDTPYGLSSQDLSVIILYANESY